MPNLQPKSLISRLFTTTNKFILVSVILLGLLSLAPLYPASHAQQHGGVIAPPQNTTDCITPEQRSLVAKKIDAFRATLTTSEASTQLYPFVPQAGNLWQDLLVYNFVDVDPTSGILDWDCSDYTYNGHRGHDIDLRSFKEQEIGVPIFAALDGTVVDAHDGEPDMQTTSGSRPANYVILGHPNGQVSWYWHMKTGSVAVTANQVVKAGTQLGLTGSSGNSTGPHLHFESRLDTSHFEPSVGKCAAGSSNWTMQLPIRRTTYARDFYFTDVTTAPDMPFETQPRLGTFLQGTSTVAFRVFLGNVAANTPYIVRYIQPNGNIALERSGNLTSPFYREAYHWWWWVVNLNTTGTWRLQYMLNDEVIVDAPFRVVSNSTENTNRPPNPINTVLDPPAPKTDEVVFCRVQTSSVTEDPDYEIMRYRYQWKLNGVVVRDVTTAALSDAIAKDRAQNGDQLTCTVTPGDGQLNGESSTSTAVYGSPLAVSVSAANYTRPELASGFIAAAFGNNLATVSLAAPSLPLPTSLGGTTVLVRDSQGVERLAPLFYVSPTQVNYQIPSATAEGLISVKITSSDGKIALGGGSVVKVTPGMFSVNADGSGYAAATFLRVKGDGSRTEQLVAAYDLAQSKFVANQIDLGDPTDQVFLTLYGTGIFARKSLADVSVTIGGTAAEVTYAGQHGTFVGVDQINAIVPRSLIGRNDVDVVVTVARKTANAIQVKIK